MSFTDFILQFGYESTIFLFYIIFRTCGKVCSNPYIPTCNITIALLLYGYKYIAYI